MPRLAVLLPVLAAVLLLSACGPKLVQTDVTRFHQPEAEAPKSFTILPEPDQRGSLEFQLYADLAAAELQRTGWRPVPSSQPADAVVLVRWGLSEPRTVTWSSPSTMGYGGMGWGPRSHWYGGGIGVPLGDPYPYWETRSATTYPKWAEVTILDAAAYKDGTRRVLFEGRAVTETTNPEITPLMPYLLQALFTGFPGSSGRTVRVALPVTPE